MIELKATSWNSQLMSTRRKKFALIGNFLDTVDRCRKNAYVACILVKLDPVNRQLVVENGRLSATGYFLSATSFMRS